MLTTKVDSNNAPRLVIDLPEKSLTLRPLLGRAISPGTVQDFKTLDLETSFDVLRAACKYEMRDVEEELRDAMRKNIGANVTQRDHAMQLAIMSADQDMILYISGVLREHGSKTLVVQLSPPGPSRSTEGTAEVFLKLSEAHVPVTQGGQSVPPPQITPFSVPQFYPPVVGAFGPAQNNTVPIQQPAPVYPNSLVTQAFVAPSQPGPSRQSFIAGPPSLPPPSPNASTLNASNISDPSRVERRNAELARIKALATAVDAAKARNAPQHEIDALVREETAATAAYCQETRTEMEAIQSRIQNIVSDVPPTPQELPPGYEQSQLERAAELARTSSYIMSPSLRWQKDCDYINSLNEQLELLKRQNAPEAVIDRQTMAVNTALRALLLKIEEEEEQEEAALRELERKQDILNAVRRSNDPKEIQRLMRELETGIPQRKKKRTCGLSFVSPSFTLPTLC
ncbi:hypothetical protein CPB86DRAFT_391240 [Serendipita vermifera]|nr:hypothetical protein CPB86DRAFT_391240 [Serendipita vermifera]